MTRHQTFRCCLRLGVVLLVAACGSGRDAPAVLGIAQNPDSGFGETVTHDLLVVGDVVYVSNSEDEILLYASPSGATEEIALPGVHPQQLIGPHTAGETGEVWMVAGDGLGGVALKAYRDSDGDGLIDPSTVTTLFSGDRPDVTRSAAFDPESGTLYLLECGTGNIYRARDTDGNRRPDTLDTTPFVEGTWMPGSSAVHTVEVPDPQTGQTQTVPTGISSNASELTRAKPDQVRMLDIGDAVDTDDDGIADEVAEYFATEQTAPSVIGGRLVAGMHRVATTGTYGATLELRKIDDQGAVIETLDTIEIDTGFGWFEPSAELNEGDLIVVHDTTNLLSSAVFTVLPEAVIVEQPNGPFSLIENETATVTIAGANLDLLDDIKLSPFDPDAPAELSLTYTVTPDGRSVDISVPALDSSWVGLAVFVFLDDGVDPDPTVNCDVCAAPGGGGS